VLIEQAIRAVPGVAECNVNFGAEQATIRYNPKLQQIFHSFRLHLWNSHSKPGEYTFTYGMNIRGVVVRTAKAST
jgi:hypothetical protein